MKKITLTLLSLVCALCCAFGLAACDGGDPAKMKSEKVTAEQWTEAFKADNFKNVKIESTTTNSGSFWNEETETLEQLKATLTSTVIIVDDVQYYKSNVTVLEGSQAAKNYVKDWNFEKYSSASNGKYTTYYKNKDGAWRQCPGEGGVAEVAMERYYEIGKMYDKFEYEDGWVKGYWTKSGSLTMDEMDSLNLLAKSFKFKDNKLVAVYNPDSELTTFVYGGQSLTLPTVEASSYVGTWKTHQLVVGTKTYNVGNAVTEMDGMPLAADFVNLEIKNDGTFTSTNPERPVTGVWMETDNGISYAEEIGGYMDPLEFDGTYLKIQISLNMTVVLAKA